MNIHYDTKSNIPNLVATYGAHTAAHKGRRATCTRCRPARRIRADEQRVRAVGKGE